MEQRITGSVIINKMQTKVIWHEIYMNLYIVFMDIWKNMYKIESRGLVREQQSHAKEDLI